MRKAFLVLALLVAGCNEDPDVGPPADLRAISIRVEGPGDVTRSAQFTAVQTWSDGSNRDVTAAAQWTSTNPAVLSVSAGLATALTAGQVDVRAQFEQLNSQPRAVRVVPVANEWDGSYALTIGAMCGAATLLPPDLRQREYTALIQQSGLSLFVVVPKVGEFGGQIVNPQVTFSISNLRPFARPRGRALVTPDLSGVIRFVASRDEPRIYRARYGVPPVSLMEVLPDGRRLVMSGSVVTTMSPSGFSGTLNGSVSLYQPSDPNLLAACTSSSHLFTLTRK